MKWYEGGIAEAVTLSRQNGAIFVVYIEGSDDKSKKLTEIFEAENVSEVLGSSSFVALKVEANSVPHQQFSEIFNQTSIPSVYFIGKTGTPLQIVTEIKDGAEILEIMNNVVVRNVGAPLNIKSEDLIKKEATHEVVCDGDVCQLVPKAGSSQSVKEETPAENVAPTITNTANSDETLNNDEELSASTEEKLKLAQDLIEKKRAQKKIEDEEAQRQKEVERRKMGQDVQKMKRWQQEQEMKQLMDERQREKREEQEARDKVKRQIEEDKRDKAARSAAANQNVQEHQQEPPKNISPRPTNSHTARLQFRLPNGTSHMHEFPSSSLLHEVNEYITSNVQVGGSFVLATTFPRREFNENDASQSLRDLQLVPNAVILVLPVSHGAVVTSSNSGVMGMIWFILTPIFNFLGYVKELIFGKPAPVTTKDTVNNEVAEGVPSSSRPMPKKRAGESVIRRHGNIHRLTDRDSDDENNTWNGNSTQQM